MDLLQFHAQHPRLYYPQVRCRVSADEAAEPEPVAPYFSVGAGYHLPGGYPWLRHHLVCAVHTYLCAMGLLRYPHFALEPVVVG